MIRALVFASDFKETSENFTNELPSFHQLAYTDKLKILFSH